MKNSPYSLSHNSFNATFEKLEVHQVYVHVQCQYKDSLRVITLKQILEAGQSLPV